MEWDFWTLTTSHDNSPILNNRSLDDEIKIDVPTNLIGLIIGRKGRNIQALEKQSGSKIRIFNNTCFIRGSLPSIKTAKNEIQKIINDAKFQVHSHHNYKVNTVNWEYIGL